MSKSPKYYFDAESIKTPCKYSKEVIEGHGLKKAREHNYKNLMDKGQTNHTMHERRAEGYSDKEYTMANKRDVWDVSCSSYKEAHFATFPEELIRPCIKAGCPKGGIVLDPFFGSGTTGAVAVQEGREYIGIELNPEYIKLANKRLSEQQIRMF